MVRGLMSDEGWAFFAPFVIESVPKRGRRPRDHRLAPDGVFWLAALNESGVGQDRREDSRLGSGVSARKTAPGLRAAPEGSVPTRREEQDLATAATEDSVATLKLDIGPAQLKRLQDFMRDIAKEEDRIEPVRAIMRLLGDRWSPVILLVLNLTGRLRHAGLRRTLIALGGERRISQRVLTLKLRAFERHGLIDRRVSNDIPPKVDYELTARGRELAQHVRAFIEWAKMDAPSDAAAPPSA